MVGFLHPLKMHQQQGPAKVLTVEGSYELVKDLAEAYNSIVLSNLSHDSRYVFCEMATNAIKMVNCSLAIATAHAEKHRKQVEKATADHLDLMKIFEECELEQRIKIEQLKGELVVQTTDSTRLAMQNRHAWVDVPEMVRKLQTSHELTNAACEELISVLQNDAS